MKLLPPRSTLFPYTTLFRSYPSKTDELEVMRRMTNSLYSSEVNAILSKEEIFEIRRGINDVRIAEPLENYRSEEHTSELQSRPHLVCRLLLEKKKKQKTANL